MIDVPVPAPVPRFCTKVIAAKAGGARPTERQEQRSQGEERASRGGRRVRMGGLAFSYGPPRPPTWAWSGTDLPALPDERNDGPKRLIGHAEERPVGRSAA